MKQLIWSALISVVLTAFSRDVRAQSLSLGLKAEGAASMAEAAREQGSAVHGAILFSLRKLDCAKCHAPGGQRLLGPDLTRIDEEATDAYLVEAILEPSKVIKKGFEAVTVITMDGQTFSGRIVRQSPKEILLRDSTADNGRLISLAKSDVDEVVSSEKSIMPDGLADQLASRQQFLDLVRSPASIDPLPL